MSLNVVITIDGPSGAGKSTVAKAVAEALGINYLNTGSLYRALAWYLDSLGFIPQDSTEMRRAMMDVNIRLNQGHVTVNDQDVTGLLRTPHIDKIASDFSAIPSVREQLLDIQREQALEGGLVADGRDMGTVVFPLAQIKIFLTAKDVVRAQRRFLELREAGDNEVTLEHVLEDMRQRDKNDSSRKVSPLAKAKDAIEIDSSDMSVEEVVERILQLVRGDGNV